MLQRTTLAAGGGPAVRRIVLPYAAGAFYAFASISHTGIGSEEFAMRLLQEAGVAVVPGHVFGAGGEGYIRCSYAASTAKLTEALERLEDFMRVTMLHSVEGKNVIVR